MMLGLIVGFTMVGCDQPEAKTNVFDADDWRLELRKSDVLTLTNDLCALLIERRPLPPGYKIRHLFLLRNDKESQIPGEPEEDWDDLHVCSETNKAFALIRTWQKSKNGWSGDIKRLVEITLPLPHDPLTEVKTRTLVEMKDLESEEGRSWISEIESVSPDGKTLLVRRAIPHKTGEHSTSWTYETFYMDVATGDLKPIGWK